MEWGADRLAEGRRDALFATAFFTSSEHAHKVFDEMTNL
jgi:hypothetical protein